ncbi:MAG: MopE-related protein, partial [Desulfuromonadales bacterium]|nr:MopE-related protein [Desulfuromonadales bacterium]
MRSNRFVLPFLIALLLLCLPQIALAVLPTVEPPSNLSVKSLDNDGQFPIRWWYSPTTDAQYELEESVDAGSSWTPVAEYVDTTTREVIRTNAAAGNHQFRVRAVKDGYDPSSWAYSGVCVVELTAQPARLLDLPATSDDGRVKLFWKRSFTTGATYVAEQQIDGGAWETVAEYTDPSINYFVKLNQPSGSYVFRLKAVKDGFADSAWVTTAPCVVTYAVCDAPTSLSAEYKANNGAVLLSWQASTEPDVKYKMEISSDGGSSWSVLYKTIKTSVLIPVAEGNAYQFRVRATKTDFGPSPYVVSSPVVVNAIAPPSNMYVKAADPDGQFPVQWWRSPTDGVTHELEESFNGGPWSAVSEYVDPTANSVTKTGAATGAYQFRIRAVKDGFTPSEWVYSTVCVVCSDADNDGYYADGDACGAQDCNDQDLSVYPGGIEVCADDVDNNCDGSVDEGCSVVFPEKVPDTGQTECFDADG